MKSASKSAKPYNVTLLVIFGVIGILIGTIFALQLRAHPVTQGSFPLERVQIQQDLLAEYSAEQEQLKVQLDLAEQELQEAQRIIERRSSPSTIDQLERLRRKTAFSTAQGSGIKITLQDGTGASRITYSSANENFVQASDLRDVVNALYLKDARAIAINGKRVTPLTTIQPVGDNLLIGNFFMGRGFVIEAIGDADALEISLDEIRKRKIKVFVDRSDALEIAPSESARSMKYIKPLEL